MSRLQYTVTVRFTADAVDTETINDRLNQLHALGEVVETKAKAVKEKGTMTDTRGRRQSEAA